MINTNASIARYFAYEVVGDENCPICLEPLKNADTVAHEGLGNLHPLHRSCAKSSAIFNSTCPICRVPIEEDSLLTLEDRIKLIKKDQPMAIARGAIGGSLGGTLTGVLLGSFVPQIGYGLGVLTPIFVGLVAGGLVGFAVPNLREALLRAEAGSATTEDNTTEAAVDADAVFVDVENVSTNAEQR
jgi:Ring finger domain